MLEILGILGAVLLATALSMGERQGEDPALEDWLVTPVKKQAAVRPFPDRKEIVLENGLIRRAFRTGPNLATIDFTNLITNTTLLRGVKPEAIVEMDGRKMEIGGLKGQPDYAYLDAEWLDEMTADPEAFRFTGYTIGEPQARYPWKPQRHAAERPWPPKGVSLTLLFQPPQSLRTRYPGLKIEVHYELYSGLPALSKGIAITNGHGREVEIGEVVCEILAVNEQEKSRLHVESDYAFADMNTTFWGPDPEYTSQIDYNCQMPLLLTSRMRWVPACV